jgi:hypothetical protein
MTGSVLRIVYLQHRFYSARNQKREAQNAGIRIWSVIRIEHFQRDK